MASSLNQSELYAIYDKIKIDVWLGLSLGTSLFGALTNIYTIVTLAFYKEFQKANYQLILCVAVSDGLCDSIFIPIETLQSYMLIKYKSLLGDDRFCIWEGGFFAVLLSTSIIGQLVIAINRFIAVYLPNFYRTRMTTRLALIIWGITSICFPTFYYYAGLTTWLESSIDRIVGDCMMRDTAPHFRSLRISLTIYIPLAGSIFAYILIFFKIILITPADRKEVFKRARGSAAMFGSMLFYGMCVLPLWISYNSTSYGDQLERTLWMKFIFRLSYTINPVFYAVLDRRIREGYLKLFRRLFKLNQVNPQNDTSDRRHVNHSDHVNH